MIRMAGMRFQPSSLHLCLICTVMISLFYIFVYSSYFSKLPSKSKVAKPNGLQANGNQFTLEKKKFVIMSGSLHYFRVHHQQWEDRLIKMKAMGLNTVDIYIPWNIHEPRPGSFVFNRDDVNIESFLRLVEYYDMYAIVRPGPYICSEWDLGGLPSWLLKDKHMKLRSLYSGFTNAVDRYFAMLLPILKKFQFSYDGPVIAFQIENEYGTYGTDKAYMDYLRLKFEEHGLEELFFVCDNMDGLGKYGKLRGVLQTINFMSKPYDKIIKKLKEIQPNKPVFVTELWDGWFSHWGEKAHKVSAKEISNVIMKLLVDGASFNLYMWHGGTNFGFLNGANANDDGSDYQSDITSYDYDAPIDETGGITPKFGVFKDTIRKYCPKSQVVANPSSQFKDSSYSSYGDIKMKYYVTLEELIKNKQLIGHSHHLPCSMEELDVGDDYGQLYGYIVYEKKFQMHAGSIKINKARDYVVVVLNGKIVHKEMSHKDVIDIKITSDQLIKSEENVLMILVENGGRVNYGRDLDNQRKGILGDVTLDDVKVTEWMIYALDFTNGSLKESEDGRLQYPWTKSLVSESSLWHTTDNDHKDIDSPTIYKGEFYVHGNAPRDTFLLLPDWYKGCVFVNGYHIGRYWNIGPQKTLYLPQEFLRLRINTIVIFDLQGSPKKLSIESVPEADLGMNNAIDFLI